MSDMKAEQILEQQKNAENAPITNYIGKDGFVWQMILKAMEAYGEELLQANGVDTKNAVLPIQHVSVSLFEQLEMQLMYHKDKENERYKCRDYREAMYHNHKAGAIEDVLNWIKHNER